MSYPIPKCLDQLRMHARILVTEGEDEQILIQAAKGATVLMITYGTVSQAVIDAGIPNLKAVIKLSRL